MHALINNRVITVIIRQSHQVSEEIEIIGRKFTIEVKTTWKHKYRLNLQ